MISTRQGDLAEELIVIEDASSSGKKLEDVLFRRNWLAVRRSSDALRLSVPRETLEDNLKLLPFMASSTRLTVLAGTLIKSYRVDRHCNKFL